MLLASCAPLVSSGNTENAGSISFTLPRIPAETGSGSQNVSRNADPYGENGCFIVTVTDNAGTVQTKRAHSGNTLSFDELAFGDATIVLIAYDANQLDDAFLSPELTSIEAAELLTYAEMSWYYGSSTCTVLHETQNVTIQMKKQEFKVYPTVRGRVVFSNTYSNWLLNQADDTTMYGGNGHLTAFCYDPQGSLITAINGENGDVSSFIRIFLPAFHGEETTYYFDGDNIVDYTFADASILPQRIAGNLRYVYFTTNEYGARDEGNNTVFFFDKAKGTTPALKTITIPDFDIVTALAYDNGRLYVAGEKKGEIQADGTSCSTLSVISYRIKADGSLDTETGSTYLSFTEEDLVEPIKTATDFTNNHNYVVDLNNNYERWIYTTISDIAFVDGTLYAIRNVLLFDNNNNRIKERALGDVIYIDERSIKQVDDMMFSHYRLGETNTNAIPYRFVALKPKEFDIAVLNPYFNGQPAFLRYNFETTREFQTVTGNSMPYDTIINIRGGSSGTAFGSTLFEHLTSQGHLFRKEI